MRKVFYSVNRPMSHHALASYWLFTLAPRLWLARCGDPCHVSLSSPQSQSSASPNVYLCGAKIDPSPWKQDFIHPTWEGETWEGETWEGKTWDGQTWDGATWEVETWDGATWEGETGPCGGRVGLKQLSLGWPGRHELSSPVATFLLRLEKWDSPAQVRCGECWCHQPHPWHHSWPESVSVLLSWHCTAPSGPGCLCTDMPQHNWFLHPSGNY